MSRQVNTNPQLSTADEETAGLTPSGAGPILTGALRRGRNGPLRALQILTGLALLRWLGGLLLLLVGYRRPARLALRDQALELRGERRLMGLTLGATVEMVPLSALKRVRLVGGSRVWTVVAGAVVLAVAGAVGTVLVMWGVAGGQFSWTVLGLSVIAVGGALDALAYLVSRGARARQRGTLELRLPGRTYRLAGAELAACQELLGRLSPRFP